MRQDKSLNVQIPWTDEETELLLRCIADEMNTRMIAARIGRTMSAVRGRIRKLRHTHGINIKTRVYVPRGPQLRSEMITKWEPPNEIMEEAKRRRSLSRSSLTAEFFGDPLPGYSALDRKLSARKG